MNTILEYEKQAGETLVNDCIESYRHIWTLGEETLKPSAITTDQFDRIILYVPSAPSVILPQVPSPEWKDKYE